MWTPIQEYEVNEEGEVRRGGKVLKGNINGNGYMRVGKQNILVHRLIAECFLPNPFNKHDVDHINGIRHDNRVVNLRWATRSENNINKKISGVVFHQGKWRPRITKDKKTYCFGLYDTQEEAIVAREKKAKELYGEFVYKNEPIV
jgi:hypothetical protein